MAQAAVATPPRTHHGWTRLAMAIVAISLIVCSYFSVIVTNFGSADGLLVFIKQANTLYNVSQIIKVEIGDKLPADIKNNFVGNAIAQKLLDVVVTPDNLYKIAEPSLKFAYQASEKTPIEIKNQQVVLETQKYKAQASQFVSQSKLPDVISQPANSLIQNAPNQLTLVDAKKNPNSPLLMAVQVRNAMRSIKTSITILWWVIIIGLLAVVALNWRDYRRILHSLTWMFGVAGTFIVVGSFVFPPVLGLIIPSSTDALIGSYINAMIADGTNYLFTATRSYGLLFVLIALIAFLVKQFEVVAWVNGMIKKLMGKPKHSSAHIHHHSSTHSHK